MERRAWVQAALCAAANVGAAALGFGAGACQAPAPKPSGLFAGTLGGVEDEILRFVGQQAPKLELRLVRFGSADALRGALQSGQLAFGSFENGVELAENASQTRSAQLASAGPSVTLPLGLYSRRLRTLSELGPGSVVALPSEGRAQGRALLVLYHYGLLDFDQELGPQVRLADVRRNPRALELTTFSASELGAQLANADLTALDYGAASRLGLEPARRALAIEDGFSPFAQVLTVRSQDLSKHPRWLAQLLEAYRAKPVKDFILRRYQDSVRRAW
jgi:ABC-type metal ion transport system substrate-binding protein